MILYFLIVDPLMAIGFAADHATRPKIYRHAIRLSGFLVVTASNCFFP